MSAGISAIVECGNELQGRVFPSLGEEGWLRHQEDAAKPPYEGADGVVSPGYHFNVNIYHNDHPVCASSEASRLFLTGAATPPVPGGERPVPAIHSHLQRPRYSSELPAFAANIDFGTNRSQAIYCDRRIQRDIFRS